MMDERPLAPAAYEAEALSIFPFETMSPEEYVARHGHMVWFASYEEYRYRSAAFDVWINEMYRILRDIDNLQSVRLRYCTEEEIEQQKREAWDSI